jgi:hypothetical protein
MTKLKHRLNIDRAYEDVEKLMHGLALRWHRRYSVPLEECRSECHVAFCKAFRRYDPNHKSGAQFSTVVQMICQFRLRRLIMDRCKAIPFVPLEEWTEGAHYAPEARSESLALVQDLSDDAKEIVSLLFEMPGDLKGFRRPMEPKEYLKRIKEYLVKKRGRSEWHVNRAAGELERTLRAAWATA